MLFRNATAVLCLLAPLSGFAANEPSQQTESVYQALQDSAYKKALGLTQLYFGVNATLDEFTPSVAGSFRMIIKVNGKVEEMYLLSDLQSIINGQLYSPLIVNADSAHGIKALTTYAKRNQTIDEARNTVLASARNLQTSSPKEVLTQRTAAMDMNTGFEDMSKPSTIGKTPLSNTESSGISPQMFADIQHLKSVSYGEGSKHIYLFADLNCTACMAAEPTLQELARGGEVTLHYIPVGMLTRPEDEGKDITDSQAKAMYTLIPNNNSGRQYLFDKLLDRRPVTDLIKEEAAQELRNRGYSAMKANTLMFFKLPLPATPLAVFTVNGIPRFKALGQAFLRKASLDSLIESIDSQKNQAQ
ncbi:MAG: hypothetical protein JXQ95_07285 [Alteromonas stellipolaris]|uniref:hypothetical protein n=1 Tax=Alteromonas stellipolaris TaxID=233316 RepID=UPI003B8D0DA0